MTHYQEIAFRVASTRFMGLGERNSNLFLKQGLYTVFANKADFTYETGYGDRQGYGFHPFLIMQLNSTRFIGLYLQNSSPF